MAIDVIVQYDSGFLPVILLLTQAPIVVWFDAFLSYIITTLLTMHYYSVFCFVW